MVTSFLFLLGLFAQAFSHDGKTIKEAAMGTGLGVGIKVQYKNQRYKPETQFDLFPEFEELVKREYDFMTTNACTTRWDIGKDVTSLEPEEMFDQMDYYNCQYMVDWAEAHNMTYRIQYLNWMKPEKSLPTLDDPAAPLEEKRVAMREYTKEVIRHMGPHVTMYDVVKEFISDDEDGGIRDFLPGVSTIDEIPDIACELFQAAKEARQEVLCGFDSNGMVKNCADAKDHNKIHLLYNEYAHSCAEPCNDSHKEKGDRVFNFIKGLVQKNCGVDSVGFQMHVNRFYDDFDGLRRNIQRYADIGISVHYTEVDVRCGYDYNDYCARCCELDMSDPEAKWTDDMLQQQAYVYGELLKVCLEEPSCDAFVMWDGADDISTWDATLPPQNPYLFDKNFQPKPAYYTVLKTLNEFPRDHPAIESRITGSWRKVDVWEPQASLQPIVH